MKPTTPSPGPFHEFVFHFINVISTRVLSSAREPSLLNLHFLARCDALLSQWSHRMSTYGGVELRAENTL